MFMSLFIAACFIAGVLFVLGCALDALKTNWRFVRLAVLLYALGMLQIVTGALARRFLACEAWFDKGSPASSSATRTSASRTNWRATGPSVPPRTPSGARSSVRSTWPDPTNPCLRRANR